MANIKIFLNFFTRVKKKMILISYKLLNISIIYINIITVINK